MKLFADYHIHVKNQKFSKLKLSIEKLAEHANMIGLSEIAIIFHGLKHPYALNKETFLQVREFINEINLNYDTKIMLGIEADVLSVDGDLDVDNDLIDLADILLIGYHKFIKTDFTSFFGKQKKTAEAVDLATDAYINAIKRYPVNIVAHPNAYIKLDLYKLGRFCAEEGVYIELNNRHLNFSDLEVYDLIRSECYFIISSDAYLVNDMAKYDNAMILIEKCNIPLERVANLDVLNGKKTKLELEIEEDFERLQRVNKKYGKKYELSSEIENKLIEIQKEKGIAISEENYDIKDTLPADKRELIEKIEYYLKTGIKK